MTKKFIKLTTIGICLLLFSINILAQTFKADYVYDANGNRTTATVVYLTKSTTINNDSINTLLTAKPDTANIPQEGWGEGFTESITNIKTTLYPNPTHSSIMVAIEGKLDVNKCFMYLYDINSTLMASYKTIKNYNLIDLSSKPNGTYMLVVFINGKSNTYKIIKE
jgi:hypothetical protein